LSDVFYNSFEIKCPRRESNPHGDFSPRDFKSRMSAIPSLGQLSLGRTDKAHGERNFILCHFL
jgi:hypothetical protein